MREMALRKISTKPMIVGTEAAWRGPDLAKTQDWIYRLSDVERHEVLDALRHFEATAKEMLQATLADFPLPTLGSRLQKMARDIDGRRGFFLLRGLPVEDMSEAHVRTLFWGIGLYLGIAIPQSGKAELITDVRDLGSSSTTRGYLSTIALDAHCDSCDLVLLLCRRKAKRGGASRLVSSVAIHDYIAETRPDILEALYQPLPVSRLACRPDIDLPWTMLPVFNWHEGHFASSLLPKRIRDAAAMQGSPGLTPTQREGVELIGKLTSDPGFYLDMDFEIGDIQFVINHQIYHSRTSFEDYTEQDLKRHILRMWLATPGGRPLPPQWLDTYSSVEPASYRGGQPHWRFPDLHGDYVRRTAKALNMAASL